MNRCTPLAVLALAALAMGAQPPSGPPFTATVGEQAANQALVLDGRKAFMQVSDSESLRSFRNAITIECWFKASSFTDREQDVSSLVRKNTDVGRENYYLRFRTMEGKPSVEFNAGQNLPTLRAAYEFQKDRWYHLAGVYNGLTLAVLVDGKQVASRIVMGRMQLDESDLFIGKGDPEYSGGEHFHGAVDEIRLWNIARTPVQIRSTMNTALSGKEPGLVGCWTFDDGTASDQTANDNDGKLGGGARIVVSPREALPVTTITNVKTGTGQ